MEQLAERRMAREEEVSGLMRSVTVSDSEEEVDDEEEEDDDADHDGDEEDDDEEEEEDDEEDGDDEEEVSDCFWFSMIRNEMSIGIHSSKMKLSF